MSRKSAARLSAGGIFAVLAIIAFLLMLPDPQPLETAPLPVEATILPGEPLPATSVPVTPKPADGKLPGWLTVYFTNPNPPDDLLNGVDQYIVPLIDAATKSVDVTSFDFNLPTVIDALVRAQERGVEVRVVYDGENGDFELDEDRSPTGKVYDGVEIAEDAGISVVDGGRSNGLMHNKIIIIDSKTLVMGSWNFSYNDTYRNNNNILIITDPTLIANYQAKFNEMFVDQVFGAKSEVGAQTPVLTIDGTDVANYFSPKDEVMQKLVALVGGARKSVKFYAFTYTHPDLAAAMIERHNAGLDVQGIIENRAATQGAMVPLYCAGVPVMLDGNKYTMHDKVIVIDDSIVITGSFNFTKTADNANDDNVLIIDSPVVAKLYLAEYEKLLAIAVEPDSRGENFQESAAKWPDYCK